MKMFNPLVLVLSFSFVLTLNSCGKRVDMTSTDAELLTASIIVDGLDWKEVTSLRSSSSIYKNAKAVGDVDLPVMGSRCTGFLISENVVMTNHHCIPTSGHSRGVTVAFNHLKGVSKANWDKYDCSTFIGNNRTLDFALLKCAGNPGRKYGFVELADDASHVDDSIYIVQQNCDYYSKRDCDWTKKYSEGKITAIDDEYTHNADTLGGSSGSPMFGKSSNVVVGIHHAGFGNNGRGRGVENYSVPMNKIVQYILTNFPQVDIGGSGDSDNDEPTPVKDGNDTFSKATTLSGSSMTKSNVAISSATDKDYYKFKATKAGKVTFTASFVHSSGDLDLKIYNGSKSQVAKSESSTNNESVTYEVSAGQTVYALVFGYKGAKANYKMAMSFVAKSSGSTGSGNDTMAGATKASSNYRVNGSISSSKDIDYFKFSVSSSKYVKVELSFKNSAGDLDLYLIDSSGNQVAKSDTTKNVEKISKRISSGTYYVLVKGYKGAKGSYKMSIK